MPPTTSNAQSREEQQARRTKLLNSYNELLEEFASKELRTVGNYTLGRLIGKGSFGKVYLATHKLTNGSKVVLKSARKDDSNLAREIHHHRQFIHPHIARLYEVIVTENLVWLVLEYCPGDELYNYLLRNGPIEPAKVQRIFTQLVGAVSYVHSKSCVHRDLKLENILLDKHEDVKLVDFGFTREYEGKTSYLQTWCGTVCYSAPEMLKGEKYAGEKVDVWSLGIILYALLRGELPFDDDDENLTKMKILKEEPKYPEDFPQGAKDLCTLLLSKRPLLRPGLSDILMNPWLSDHAPHQQAILKLEKPAPFATDLEKETLQRMRSAGVDIDMVIENVLAQRCDATAGWWSLLIEKEERKAKRRERKRKDREAEVKSIRRLSAASSALDRLAPTIKETDEEGQASPLVGDPPKSRGRKQHRLSTSAAVATDLPSLVEAQGSHSTVSLDKPPPPIDKNSVRGRSVSSSRHRRPAPPPKEYRHSMLRDVSTNPELLTPNGLAPKRRKRYQQPFFAQLASLKSWFKETSKRAKSPNTTKTNTPSPKQPGKPLPADARRGSSIGANGTKGSGANGRPEMYQRGSYPSRPRVLTDGSQASTVKRHSRQSLSPSPLTPHSSYRRSSAGLRGRKSTSSSISSVRSIHHHHSHSKASSTSSNSIASPAVSTTSRANARSPHTSVKVLPATPTTSTFPSNIRVVRSAIPPSINLGGGGGGESSAAFGSLPPPSPGLIFAKRKRSPFKGPTLNLGTHSSPSGGSSRRQSEAGGSRSGSVQGRKSGEMVIEEEDEDEVEEVDAFSPVVGNDEEEIIQSVEEEGEHDDEEGDTTLKIPPEHIAAQVMAQPVVKVQTAP